MDFRLNKIDTDLREKLQEETKDGKVHRKKKLKIDDNSYRENNKDSSHKNKHSEESFAEMVKKQKVTIDAVKGQTLEVQVEKEPSICDDINYRGVFIDTKK